MKSFWQPVLTRPCSQEVRIRLIPRIWHRRIDLSVVHAENHNLSRTLLDFEDDVSTLYLKLS